MTALGDAWPRRSICCISASYAQMLQALPLLVEACTCALLIDALWQKTWNPEARVSSILQPLSVGVSDKTWSSLLQSWRFVSRPSANWVPELESMPTLQFRLDILWRFITLLYCLLKLRRVKEINLLQTSPKHWNSTRTVFLFYSSVRSSIAEDWLPGRWPFRRL